MPQVLHKRLSCAGVLTLAVWVLPQPGQRIAVAAVNSGASIRLAVIAGSFWEGNYTRKIRLRAEPKQGRTPGESGTNGIRDSGAREGGAFPVLDIVSLHVQVRGCPAARAGTWRHRGWKGNRVARMDAAAISELHARVCKAMADPTRLLIINELRDGPRSVGDLAEALAISQPNVSRHLAVLRDRGFVTAERFGSSVHYGLASPKVLRAMDLLREFMTEQLGGQPAARLVVVEPAVGQ